MSETVQTINLNDKTQKFSDMAILTKLTVTLCIKYVNEQRSDSILQYLNSKTPAG